MDARKVYSYAVGKHSGIYANEIKKEEEDQIGWKGAFIRLGDSIHPVGDTRCPVLVKLSIPKDAWRTFFKDKTREKYSKHRCSYAKVLGFYSYYTGKELKNVRCAYSFFDCWFEYRKDFNVFTKDNSFGSSLRICERGIHYFNTKESARVYMDYSAEFKNFPIRANHVDIERFAEEDA